MSFVHDHGSLKGTKKLVSSNGLNFKEKRGMAMGDIIDYNNIIIYGYIAMAHGVYKYALYEL